MLCGRRDRVIPSYDRNGYPSGSNRSAPPLVSVRRQNTVGVRTSSYAIAGGTVLFALPVPGTFITGGLAIAGGVAGRALGH